MNNYIISIVIPMFKVEKYIVKCLNSILNQVKGGIEIVLVDDGSPDKCGMIADEYAIQYNFIKSYHKVNGGLSDARNYGIKKSTGDYIWFVDSDDYIEAEGVDKLLNVLKDSSPDVLIIQSKKDNGIIITDERHYTIKPGIYDSREYMEQINTHPEAVIFCAQYAIVQRSFLINNNLYFYPNILHEDELWTPQVLINAHSIIYSGINIYHHVMREGSIMNSMNLEKSGTSYLIITKELFKIFKLSKRDDLIYLRDHAVDTFLQAAWKIPNYLSKYDANRLLPIKNAHYKKTIIKAFLYALSPLLYLKIHNLYKLCRNNDSPVAE